MSQITTPNIWRLALVMICLCLVFTAIYQAFQMESLEMQSLELQKNMNTVNRNKRLLEQTNNCFDRTKAGQQTILIERPFSMPLSGHGFEIFQPLYDRNITIPALIESPNHFIPFFENRSIYIDKVLERKRTKEQVKTEAIEIYLELIISIVSATAFGSQEKSIIPKLREKRAVAEFDPAKRLKGNDWTYLGDTMTGIVRLNNVRNLLRDVMHNNINGDYIETGVWRGGSSVFAKAVMSTELQGKNRKSYVCDSFRGLPSGDRNIHKGDQGWDHTPYLEVPDLIVAENFLKLNLLDSKVIFVKGFFKDTMPILRDKIESLAIMRLDGDMYQSTVDVLYNLYNKLNVGGYVIIDDWFGFPAKDACEDFFKVHKFSPKIVPVDTHAAYFKKTEQVEIQYCRYKEAVFKPNQHCKDSN